MNFVNELGLELKLCIGQMPFHDYFFAIFHGVNKKWKLCIYNEWVLLYLLQLNYCYNCELDIVVLFSAKQKIIHRNKTDSSHWINDIGLTGNKCCKYEGIFKCILMVKLHTVKLVTTVITITTRSSIHQNMVITRQSPWKCFCIKTIKYHHWLNT